MMQLEVERRMSSPHGCQILNPGLRVSSLPNEEGVHLFLSSRVHIELLKAEMCNANVDGLIRAGVSRDELKSLTGSEVVEPSPLSVLAAKGARLSSLIEQIMQVNQDGACGARDSGATDFLLADGVLKVVAGMEVVVSVRGGHTEDEACPGDGKDGSPSVEAGNILEDGAVASSGDSYCAEGGYLLEACA